MNLHALRLFHTVATTGSVTRAAETLNISQPSITAQIKKFEQELSLTLLKPQGRGIAVTDSGQRIAQLAQRLFAVERQIEQFAQECREGTSGHVRLAATYLPSHFLLPAWIARFKQRYDAVELSIVTTNSSEALRHLLNVDVDMAIYGGLPEQYPDEVETEELFQDELWFVVSSKHRLAGRHIALEEMMQEPFVMREEGSSTRERLFALCRTHSAPAPKVALQFNGLYESVRAVVSGYGASFVSSLVVREYVERGELSRVFVEGVRLRNTIAVCTRRNEALSAAAANLIGLMRSSPYRES